MIWHPFCLVELRLKVRGCRSKDLNEPHPVNPVGILHEASKPTRKSGKNSKFIISVLRHAAFLRGKPCWNFALGTKGRAKERKNGQVNIPTLPKANFSNRVNVG